MFIRRTFGANKASTAPAMMLPAEDRTEGFLTDQALIGMLIWHPFGGSPIVGKGFCTPNGSTSSVFWGWRQTTITADSEVSLQHTSLELIIQSCV